MDYLMQLSDSTGSSTLPEIEVPLTTTIIEGATDVTVLSLNVYTDFITQKRVWTHTWSTLTDDEFALIKGYYDRQFTLYQYPQLTIADKSITNVPVRMSMTPENIIDKCGTVSDVTVTFRESKQQGS